MTNVYSRLPEEYQVSATGPSGQIVMIEQDRSQRRRRCIPDIFAWMKAFSCYAAAITPCETTTSAQAIGLVAHLHLILQLSQDLGPQWQKYDTEFRQWAAARNIRQWGDLNFTIYRHCLSAQQRHSVLPRDSQPAISGRKRFLN